MEPPLERPFVGREQELRSLRELHGRTGSQVAVVYGRRRVGKTALVRQAFAGEQMLSFEGLLRTFLSRGQPTRTA